MSHFVETLEKTILANDRQKARQITLALTPFQKIQPQTKRLLETFSLVTVIKIIDCDLRTLDNFPFLPNITEVHLPMNKLQGEFKNLKQLTLLKYIDLSNNLITKSSNLASLKSHKDLTVCVVGNPFIRKQVDWKNTIKSYNLTLEDKFKNELPEFKIALSPHRIESDLEAIRLRAIKRKESQQRTFNRPIQSLMEMVQSINCPLSSALRFPRNSVQNRRSPPPLRPLREQLFDFGDPLPILTRHEQPMPPSQIDSQRPWFIPCGDYLNDPTLTAEMLQQPEEF